MAHSQKKFLWVLLALFMFLVPLQLAAEDKDILLNNVQFESLLNCVSNGWNTNNARQAADCFSDDAVYIEPPDRQLYIGREMLFKFFGGTEGRINPMKMTWHHIVFDSAKQVGMSEYTFAYKGKKTHGIVLVKVKNGKIYRWREYQYRSNMKWDEFIGESQF